MKTGIIRSFALAGVAAAVIGAGLGVQAQQAKKFGYKDTPMLPGDKWHVHDSDRPQPKVVDPGTASTQDQPGRAPSDAIVLFDGKDLSKWKSDKGGPAEWTLGNGYFAIKPGAGSLLTKQEFGDCQLHIEWTEPENIQGEDQGRGNSGVLFFGRYEVQVLDCYNSQTYADGTTAALYGQYPPLVNACRKPGQWQTYDIIFNGPRFDADGKVVRPAYATVLFNGVVVHNHTALLGPMVWRQLAHYTPHGDKGPLALQDHGNAVRYRNVWIRELKDYDEQ